MGFFSNLFNSGQDSHQNISLLPNTQGIRFGRYTDNNKSKEKTAKWFQAEELYKQKKYQDSIDVFFEYISDEKEDNVIYIKNEKGASFTIIQGSSIVQGSYDEHHFSAKASLVTIESPSVPAMRRLLELNSKLFYTRYAISNQTIYLCFDTPIDMVSPNKLYYGLKELATKADKNDDILLSDFSKTKATETFHLELYADKIIEIKYHYFTYWIDHTLQKVESLNQDLYSGGIAYILLTLIYRLDYMIMPEGKLLNELEQMNEKYWIEKESKSAVERNQVLVNALRLIRSWPQKDIITCFYNTKSTFSISLPKHYSEVIVSIQTSLENISWYLENKEDEIALIILEYALLFPQYSFSLPHTLNRLIRLYMQINYPFYFKDLGITVNYTNDRVLNKKLIIQHINIIIQEYGDKYPQLEFDTSNLNFTNLINFNISFLQAMLTLNFDH